MKAWIYRLFIISALFFGWNTALIGAAQNLDSLFSIWNNPQSPDSNRLQAISEISWSGYLYTQPDSAGYYANLHYEFAKACLAGESVDENYFKEEMAMALNTQAVALYLRGDYENALSSFEESLALRQFIGKPEQIASSLRNIASIYTEKGDYPKAMDIMEESLAIYTDIGDHAGQAGIYNNMGITFKAQGLYAEAIASYSKALSIFRLTEEKRHMASALNNIANLYRIMEDIDAASEHFQQSLEMREAMDDMPGVATTLNNLGRLHLNAFDNAQNDHAVQDELNSSRAYFNRAYTISRDIKSLKEEALSLNGLGQVAMSESLVDSAIHCFSSGLAIRKQLKKKAGISSSLNLLAEAYLEKDGSRSVKRAEYYASQALELAQSIDHLIQVEHATRILHTCYKRQGHAHRALEMYEQHIAVRDSLMSDRNQKAIIHQQYRNSYEKQAYSDSLDMILERKHMAEREQSLVSKLSSRTTLAVCLASLLGLILLLGIIYRLNQGKKQLQSVAEINALRLDSNESEMKALRSQMKPHFIFNSLQSIQTFLLAQDTEQANEYLLKFSKLMRLVLENSEENEVPIINECQALELYMQLESIRLKQPFTHEITVGDGIDKESERIPPLILQPLVENAIWHGLQHKPEPGHIQIKIEPEENGILCIVEDNGIGREAVGKLKQDYSIKKESMGLRITKDRLRVRNEINQTRSTFEMIDLTSADGTATGTRVEMRIQNIA